MPDDINVIINTGRTTFNATLHRKYLGFTRFHTFTKQRTTDQATVQRGAGTATSCRPPVSIRLRAGATASRSTPRSFPIWRFRCRCPSPPSPALGCCPAASCLPTRASARGRVLPARVPPLRTQSGSRAQGQRINNFAVKTLVSFAPACYFALFSSLSLSFLCIEACEMETQNLALLLDLLFVPEYLDPYMYMQP